MLISENGDETTFNEFSQANIFYLVEKMKPRVFNC